MKRLCLLLMCLAFIPFAVNCKTHKSYHKPCQSSSVLTYQLPSTAAALKDSVASHRKHKLIAAVLALPFGIFGLHRVYLGTSAGVPLIYIATFGGAFGILPFTDFVIILLCKDINVYAHNPKLFMWTKKK